MRGHHVGVPDQRGVADGLKPHDGEQGILLIPSPEIDPGRNLSLELGLCHVGLVPTIFRDDAAVCLCGLVDDCQYWVEFISSTTPDHRRSSQRERVQLLNALLE